MLPRKLLEAAHDQASIFNSAKMKFLLSSLQALLFFCTSIALAASAWSFDDASVAVQAKGAGVGGGQKEQ